MKQEFRDVRLEAMLEKREHLMIRIEILENNLEARAGALAAAKEEATALEQDIAGYRPLYAQPVLMG